MVTPATPETRRYYELPAEIRTAAESAIPLSVPSRMELLMKFGEMIAALKGVLNWAQSQCPCHEETPNPCPLCGASVENLEACKAVESIFPRDLLRDVRTAIGKD